MHYTHWTGFCFDTPPCLYPHQVFHVPMSKGRADKKRRSRGSSEGGDGSGFWDLGQRQPFEGLCKLASQSYHNKDPQTGLLKTNTDCLTVLEAESPKLRCPQVMISLKSPGEDLTLPWLASGVFSNPSYGPHLPVCLSVSVSKSPVCKGTSQIKATLLILT